MANSKYEYVKSFEVEDKLMPSTWIVIRIDGCHFHRFSEVHEFDKPNDEQALNLMNSCALSVLEEFPDIVFSYGISDEYSFVMKKTTQFYQRRARAQWSLKVILTALGLPGVYPFDADILQLDASKILSLIVSLFSTAYVMKWKEFFPHKELKYPPYFDGRVVCYPSNEILRDYLSWRQVDCHINNQYNTCFWMLVKSGKSKREAQDLLKGTQTQEKNELLFQQFGINYNTLPAMFRKGSCVFRDKVEDTVRSNDEGGPVKRYRRKAIVDHCDIIGPGFWNEHPDLLGK